MAVRVADTLGVMGEGGYPIVNAPDVSTRDGDLQTVLDNIEKQSTTKDYNDLINKPVVNGTELEGEVEITDPTIPQWAKEENKPTYTAEEVGAVNENNAIPLSEIDAIFNGIFT